MPSHLVATGLGMRAGIDCERNSRAEEGTGLGCVTHSDNHIQQHLILFCSVDSELTGPDYGLVQGGLTKLLKFRF